MTSVNGAVAPLTSEQSLTTLRVLVIEDSPEVRRRLVHALAEIAGVEVIGTAAGAQFGVELAIALKPDLVTLDLELTDSSGFDVLRAIKRQTPAPRVAVVSNYSNRHIRRRCMDEGADFFFDKSLEFDALLRTVAALPRPTA